ncbi:MAG: DUF2164 domain-containing protein [Gemmatimonadota bacterium]|nr:DUF2164 domain-containing protein [Gemmatimonadota bacterium]MDH4348089.1 DUF2164 domain-containing protein [Gemmatimonadota bacterium]
MAVTLSNETRKHAPASLKRFWTENLETDVSDLQAIVLLEFIPKEIGPSAYNAGVADAQAYHRDRLEDLEGSSPKALPLWTTPPVFRATPLSLSMTSGSPRASPPETGHAAWENSWEHRPKRRNASGRPPSLLSAS